MADIYLIGKERKSLGGQKLPSAIQVLSVFHYYHYTQSITIRQSSDIVSREVLSFWEKIGIPTQTKAHIINKIETLYNEWMKLKKNRYPGKTKHICAIYVPLMSH